MKTIKSITLIIVSFISFAFVTSCSSVKNMPYDDVYYSVSGNNAPSTSAVTTTAVPAAQAQTTNQTNNYQKGTIEMVGQNNYGPQDTVTVETQNTASTVSQKENKSKANSTEGVNNNCNCDNSNFSISLGFGSDYFGSSPWAWDYGFSPYSSFYGWGYSPFYYGSYFYDPYFYDPFFSYYPGYGWGGFNPYYSWYGSPYGFYDYYNPYYYNYGYGVYGTGRGLTYQARRNRFGGSNVPRSVVSGGAYFGHAKSTRLGNTVSGINNGKRVSVNAKGHDGKKVVETGNQGRPVGSMRYQSQLAKQKSLELNKQAAANRSNTSGNRSNPVYRKPNNARMAGSRLSGSNIPISRTYRSANPQKRYQKPVGYRQERTLPKPRYQKPQQYRSLDSHQSRNANVYYRAPMRRPVMINRSNQPANQRKRNTYQPSYNRTRSVYRPSKSQPAKVRTYSRPYRSNSSSRSYSAPSRSYRAPSRSFSAPERSSSSGSGSVSRPVRTGGGGGGIRR